MVSNRSKNGAANKEESGATFLIQEAFLSLYKSNTLVFSQASIVLGRTSFENKRQAQKVTDRPDMVGEACGHCW